MRVLGVVLLVSLVSGGCTPIDASAPKREFARFDCDRGFKRTDWKAQRLKTAQSISTCGWVDGWSERKLRKELGDPISSDGGYSVWEVASSQGGLGPTNWFLVVKFRDGQVARAYTETRSV